MRKKQTKIDKLAKLLERRELTVSQAQRGAGFACPNAVTGAICVLRSEGWNIKTIRREGHPAQYSLG